MDRASLEGEGVVKIQHSSANHLDLAGSANEIESEGPGSMTMIGCGFPGHGHGVDLQIVKHPSVGSNNKDEGFLHFIHTQLSPAPFTFVFLCQLVPHIFLNPQQAVRARSARRWGRVEWVKFG